MLTVSYIITTYNKSAFIPRVIESLKVIKGNFRKQFIFVDNGSSDNSLELIKSHSKELTNITIISRKKSDKASILREVTTLAYGDYLHFIEGDNILVSDATSNLLSMLLKYKAKVAIGLRGEYNITCKNFIPNSQEKPTEQVIANPIQALLQEKKPLIGNVGASNSLIKKDLLTQIIRENNLALNQKFTLALSCAIHSNFIYYPKTISYSPAILGSKPSLEKKIDYLNTFIALKHFIEFSPDTAEKYKYELYKKVYSTLVHIDKRSLYLLPHYLIVKYCKSKFKLSDLNLLIKSKIKTFFHIFSSSPLEAENL